MFTEETHATLSGSHRISSSPRRKASRRLLLYGALLGLSTVGTLPRFAPPGVIQFPHVGDPPLAAAAVTPSAPESEVAIKTRVVETYGKLPLSFEENRGQTDAAVKFLSRGNGYSLFLTPTEAVLALRQQVASSQHSVASREDQVASNQ